MSVLTLANVTQRFLLGRDAIVVLDDVSLEVDQGDFVAIHGERRSGKSTLLRVAGAWEAPQCGSLTFQGEDVWRLSDGARAQLRRRGGVGLLCGEWRPMANKPALRHVQEVLLCRGFSLREAQAPALQALRRVGLADHACTPSNRLARGELLRLAVAQRLVHEPRVLLVDEPAVLLRPAEAAEFYSLLEDLGRDPGLALIVASEELTPLRAARRMFSLDRGRLLARRNREGQVVEFPARRSASESP
jgi:ABC-type ATPase involved in cell division